ncbi:hypothetical protein PPERSA_04828 [Pseudocohnilembus persalinus]|uniref:MORN motif n=1 Tax=Pseudocohnilembus persalinus TaxID=266149 RepID=A0A0V0QJ23_PSEPJ|nr:hypothetical protein PPERSA_04828 [Pseudocohnilembus persalinus]|eukprot:KRX02206.1 hypothetical protein PPERSA_04828 [Pseudocohnilembus persalinus]
MNINKLKKELINFCKDCFLIEKVLKNNIYAIKLKNNIVYLGEINQQQNSLDGLGLLAINLGPFDMEFDNFQKNQFQQKSKYWVYVGEFKDNSFEGYGKIYYDNGDKYDGYFKNGMRSGKGEFTKDYNFDINKKGQIYDWVQDICVQKQELGYKTVWRGNFQNDIKYLERDKNQKKLQEWNFVQKLIANLQGDIYEGHFRENSMIKEGKGIFYYFKGDTYFVGKHYYRNGKVYSGEWGSGQQLQGLNNTFKLNNGSNYQSRKNSISDDKKGQYQSKGQQFLSPQSRHDLSFQQGNFNSEPQTESIKIQEFKPSKEKATKSLQQSPIIKNFEFNQNQQNNGDIDENITISNKVSKKNSPLISKRFTEIQIKKSSQQKNNNQNTLQQKQEFNPQMIQKNKEELDQFILQLESLDYQLVKQKYQNGNQYYGQINEQGKRQGKGVFYFKQGDIYFGNFSNNFFHGEGQYCFNNGEFYKGYFQSSAKEGQGMYCYWDGGYYDGDWKNNQKDGYGVFWDQYIEELYKGQWKQNKKNGEGIIIKNGEIIKQGVFVNNKLQQLDNQ